MTHAPKSILCFTLVYPFSSIMLPTVIPKNAYALSMVRGESGRCQKKVARDGVGRRGTWCCRREWLRVEAFTNGNVIRRLGRRPDGESIYLKAERWRYHGQRKKIRFNRGRTAPQYRYLLYWLLSRDHGSQYCSLEVFNSFKIRVVTLVAHDMHSASQIIKLQTRWRR